MKRIAAISVLLCLVSCRSGSPGARESGPAAPEFVRGREGASPLAAAREGAGDAVVARVGGAEIRRSDIGDFVLRYFRDQANEAVTQLVDETILSAEAKAHGIEVPEELARQRIEEEARAFEQKVRVQFGAETSAGNYLRDRYGLTPEEHRRDLARLVRVQLLRDRVIRFTALREERAEIREAVFADEAEARRAAEAARSGADLSALAEAGGIRASTALPPVPRSEISPPELAERVFALGEGEVGEPVAVVSEGRRLWHVFKMVRKLPARAGGYGELRAGIEADLAARPVSSLEYMLWARRAREAYGLSAP
ncbi:MAG: peptidylprolyl isomerase [Planctomycetes bacterium]|nr:peptidylprolyl isomerase [Planctomycetota bacterium]